MKRLGLILGSALALAACANNQTINQPIKKIQSTGMPSYLKPYDSNEDRKIEGKEIELLVADLEMLTRTRLIKSTPFNGWEDFAEVYKDNCASFKGLEGVRAPNPSLDYSRSNPMKYPLFIENKPYGLFR